MLISEIERLVARIRAEHFDGGPGSGNWGHKGRKGQRGGSAPGGGKKYRMEKEGGTYTSRAQKRKKLNRPSKYVKMHTYEDGEFDRIPLASKIRVRGYKGFFYSVGDGDLICPDTGQKISGSSLKDKVVAYRVPGYRVPTRDEEDALEDFADGTREPHEKVAVKGSLSPDADGMEIKVSDGRTFVANKGKWLETGPGGYRVVPDSEIPQDSAGIIDGVVTGNVYDFTLRRKGVNSDSVDGVERAMRDCPKELRDSYTRAFVTGGMVADVKGKNGAYYSPSQGSVHIRRDSSTQTILHEYGHLMDDAAPDSGIKCSGSSRKLQGIMSTKKRQQDKVALANELGLEVSKGGVIKGQKYQKQNAYWTYMHSSKMKNVKPGNMVYVSDIISSATDNGLGETCVGGHKTSYWKDLRPSGKQIGIGRFCEPFSNFMLLKATGDTAALEAIKTMVPNLYNAMEQVYNESYGG